MDSRTDPFREFVLMSGQKELDFLGTDAIHWDVSSIILTYAALFAQPPLHTGRSKNGSAGSEIENGTAPVFEIQIGCLQL